MTPNDLEVLSERITEDNAASMVSEVFETPMCHPSTPNIPSVQPALENSNSCLQLTAAYLSLYRPAVQDSRQRVAELLAAQRRSLAALHLNIERCGECDYTYNVPDMLRQLSMYRDRLQQVQRAMSDVHSRCGRIKTRAARLLAAVQTRADRRRHSQRLILARFAGSETALPSQQPEPPPPST